MNATITRRDSTAAETRAGRGVSAPDSAPFAALPHGIAADPRLSPTDVRVLLALLFYARSKAVCWPSDRSIALRIGRSIGTVQRSLRRLVALGLVERRKADNPTGRELVLRWRSTPTSPALAPPASRARDELRREGEEERPSSAACREGMPPPAGETTEEDLRRFRRWANGPDPTLIRFGRTALRLAGVDPDAVAPAFDEIIKGGGDPSPVEHIDDEKGVAMVDTLGGTRETPGIDLAQPEAVGQAQCGKNPHCVSPAQPTALAPQPGTPRMPAMASPIAPWSQGLPRPANVSPRRRAASSGVPRRGVRHVLDGLGTAPAVLPVRAVRASP